MAMAVTVIAQSESDTPYWVVVVQRHKAMGYQVIQTSSSGVEYLAVGLIDSQIQFEIQPELGLPLYSGLPVHALVFLLE